MLLWNYLVAFMSIFAALCINPNLLKINLKFVLKYGFIIILVGLIKYVLFGHILKFIPPGMMEFLLYVKLSDFLFVFLEDAAYTLSLLILDSLHGKFFKYFKYLLFPILCINFAMGHLYQGVQGFIFSLVYIPLTYKIAKNEGLGTVMCLHTIWDVVIYISAVQIVANMIR